MLRNPKQNVSSFCMLTGKSSPQISQINTDFYTDYLCFVCDNQCPSVVKIADHLTQLSIKTQLLYLLIYRISA